MIWILLFFCVLFVLLMIGVYLLISYLFDCILALGGVYAASRKSREQRRSTD